MTADTARRAIAIYGWGVVAPGASNMSEFEALLERGETALRTTASNELGDALFPVGDPVFDLETYRPWIEERFGDARVQQLKSKMGDNALFAIGAFIQALGPSRKLESVLRELDEQCHVLVGSGVGDLPQSYAARASLDKAVGAWNRFWSNPSRNTARKRHAESRHMPAGAAPPTDPTTCEVDSDERHAARIAWEAFWARHSDARAAFEVRYAEIERMPVGDDAEKGPLHAIRARERAHRKLMDETGCPTPPWEAVDPKLVWAIQNVPAAQITMLLGTHGAAWAPVAACSTFGVALKCACDAIQRGEARAVVVGTCDPRPDPTLIAAFHRARLAPALGRVNFPFTSLFGTHIAGGACVWIIGDMEYCGAKGLSPVGPRIDGIAVSADAEHIITPSASGPKHAIRRAMSDASVLPADVALWESHATGTPGDVSELKLTHDFVTPDTAIGAHKGLFGHGMANSGGWELTAMALGLQRGRIASTGIAEASLHPWLRERYGHALVTQGRELRAGAGVKVMLGIGGVTACVVMRCAK